MTSKLSDNHPRFIAEWEHQSGVLVTIPHSDTDWADILDDTLACYREIITAVLDSGEIVYAVCRNIKEASEQLSLPYHPNLKYIEIPINDTWIRDYGPLSVATDSGEIEYLDFGFNGWGLKFAADKDNLVNLHLSESKEFDCNRFRNLRSFILEGGSVETDGCDTLLTTSRCLCSPNRNGSYTQSEIEQLLQRELGISRFLWLDHGYLAGDDTDSHIDTLARICPNDTIVFVGCNDSEDEHFCELQKMKQQLENFRTKGGAPFRLLELPFPDKIYDNEGNRLPATYANYLVLNDRILLPTYCQPCNDDLAAKVMAEAYPDKQIIQIDCSILIHQHGSLHCSTMQLHNLK